MPMNAPYKGKDLESWWLNIAPHWKTMCLPNKFQLLGEIMWASDITCIISLIEINLARQYAKLHFPLQP